MMIPGISSKVCNAIFIATLIFGLVSSVFVAWYAGTINHSPGFPLDDPWIHLQFAKNLNEYGSFSYYRDEMATSGSTSPLYTTLLAVGFFVTSNEIVLSYVLGVGFFLASAVFASKLGFAYFPENWLIASAPAILVLMEPRLLWVSLSGMETTLFIFLIIAATLYYQSRSSVPLGIIGGLMLWTRPEAVIFFVLLAAEALYHAWIVRRISVRGKRAAATVSYTWLKNTALITGGFALAYVAFNLSLSGSVFPNTYAAKIRYYSGGQTNFPAQVFDYLTTGHLSVFALFVGIGVIHVVVCMMKRQPTALLIHLLWPLAMFFAYWQKLPYLYQEGRYLMPILPSVIFLGLAGVFITSRFLMQRVTAFKKPRIVLALQLGLLVLFSAQFVHAGWDIKDTYTESCKYISDRQVRTAKWLGENLPAEAVIGTHDIGAIGYYSGRRVADMVGLVSPEMIENIGSYAKLQQFLVSRKVTHVAVLRNWFGIDNVEPLFQTDEEAPEIMEVFEFQPGRIHFLSHDLYMPMQMARAYLKQGKLGQAGPILEEVVRRDPQSSRGQFLLGVAFMMSGAYEKAGEHLQTAVRLRPEYPEAWIVQAELLARQGHSAQAMIRLEQIVKERPLYAPAYQALADAHRLSGSDSSVVQQYVDRYHELSNSKR